MCMQVHVHGVILGYLRKCRCSIGPICCPVVFHMGVVDQTHCDNHGQELFELILVVNFFVPAVYARVRRESCCVNILLSIDVSLLNNMIQHGIVDQKLEKNQAATCQSCQPKGPLAARSLGWEVHHQMAHYPHRSHHQSPQQRSHLGLCSHQIHHHSYHHLQEKEYPAWIEPLTR